MTKMKIKNLPLDILMLEEVDILDKDEKTKNYLRICRVEKAKMRLVYKTKVF